MHQITGGGEISGLLLSSASLQFPNGDHTKPSLWLSQEKSMCIFTRLAFLRAFTDV